MYEKCTIYFVRVVPLEWMHTNVQNDMDEDFKTFLSKKGYHRSQVQWYE
jgi:hypothetical protein